MECNTDEKRTFVLLIGCTRSGTTLLSEVLSKHPSIFMAPETKYFSQVWGQRNMLRFLPGRARSRVVVESLLDGEYPRRDRIFPDHVDSIGELFADNKDYLGNFFNLIKCLTESPIIGEKTPLHTFFAQDVARADHSVKIAAMCRDAPAVVASTLGRKGFRRVRTIGQCVARWIMFNREILTIQKTLPPEKFYLISFEQLIQQPKETVNAICRWLEIDFNDEMLRPTYQDSSLRIEPASGPSTERFDTGTLHRWKENLTDEQTRLIRALTRPLAENLGYSRSDESAGIMQRLNVFKEMVIFRIGIHFMRLGIYPFGICLTCFRYLRGRFSRRTT